MTETALETGGDEMLADLEAAFDAPEDNEILEEVEQAAEAAPAEDLAEEQPAEEPIEEAAEEVEPQEPDNSEGGSDVAPPQHWRGDGKIDWNRLPAGVKKAISEDYAQRAQTDARYSQVENVLGDRWDRMAAQHGSVESALKQHVAIADFAERDPAGYVQWFCQQAGIQLPGNGQQADPAEQRYQQLEQQLQALQGTIQHQSTAQLNSQIEAFASDPAHPYFEDVRRDMGALIQSGAAKDLQDAYDKAIWADPVIRQRLLDDQKAAADAERAERVKKAKAAKTPTGAPGAGGTVNDAPASSITDEVARAFEAMGG